MKPEDKQALNAAVLRVSAEDPTWVGYWIELFMKSEGIHADEITRQLGLSADAFALLCLCKTPPSDNFEEDLRFICKRTGAKDEVLARIIRQGQALSKWSAQTQADTTTGWLLAASDADDDIAEDGGNAEADGDER
jgi:hypothetical protein